MQCLTNTLESVTICPFITDNVLESGFTNGIISAYNERDSIHFYQPFLSDFLRDLISNSKCNKKKPIKSIK